MPGSAARRRRTTAGRGRSSSSTAPRRRVIENNVPDGDRSMTYHQGNCSYRRADTVRGVRPTEL